MARLKPDVKRFIVQALACFDTPSQVAEAVKEQFGLEISRMAVSAYDPDKAMGANLSKDLVTLFRDTRKKFKEATEDIPIAQRAFRLRAMSRVLTRAENSRNSVLTLQALEQAAKEVGDIFVNKNRSSDGNDTPALPVKVEIAVRDATVRRADNKSGT